MLKSQSRPETVMRLIDQFQKHIILAHHKPVRYAFPTVASGKIFICCTFPGCLWRARA